MKYEIDGGARTKYRGAEEDWAPTKKFVEKWVKNQLVKAGLPQWAELKLFVLVRDVNYATDEKIDGTRTAHYEISTYFDITQYRNIGGSVIVTREDPSPWMNYKCIMIDVTLPYSWFNPELKVNEPGYIQIRLAAPCWYRNLELGKLAEELSRLAFELEHGYNHMIDTKYKGSRNTITDKNDEAEFSVKIRTLPSLSEKDAQAYT